MITFSAARTGTPVSIVPRTVHNCAFVPSSNNQEQMHANKNIKKLKVYHLYIYFDA